MNKKSLHPTYKSDHKGKAGNTTFEPLGGLTKREYFTAAALQGILSNTIMGDSDLHNSPDEWLEDISDTAIKFADRVIKDLGSGEN